MSKIILRNRFLLFLKGYYLCVIKRSTFVICEVFDLLLIAMITVYAPPQRIMHECIVSVFL